MIWINGDLPPLPPKPQPTQAESPGDPGGQSWNTSVPGNFSAPWWLWSLIGMLLLAYGLLMCWLLFAWWLHP